MLVFAEINMDFDGKPQTILIRIVFCFLFIKVTFTDPKCHINNLINFPRVSLFEHIYDMLIYILAGLIFFSDPLQVLLLILSKFQRSDWLLIPWNHYKTARFSDDISENKSYLSNWIHLILEGKFGRDPLICQGAGRGSRPEVLFKKDALRNFTKFTGKHLCQSLFFNQAAGLRPAASFAKRLWHRCFPVSFAKFLKTPFLQNTSGRLLLASAILFQLFYIFLCLDFFDLMLSFAAETSAFISKPRQVFFHKIIDNISLCASKFIFLFFVKNFCFPVNFVKFLNTPRVAASFSKEASFWLVFPISIPWTQGSQMFRK